MGTAGALGLTGMETMLEGLGDRTTAVIAMTVR
jgi:hypothetical protein